MEKTGGYPMVNTANFPPTVKWCSVPYEEAVAAMRLEASVFGIDGRHARQAVKTCPFGMVPLTGNNGCANAYVGGRFKRIWLEHSALPIFQPSSIADIKPTPDGYLAKSTDTNLDALRVRNGQVLISCSGTIGKVAFVAKALENHIFSHDLIRVTAKNKNDSGFLYAYLRSRTGNTILQTGKYGAVIQHIEPEHLSDIPVPDAPVAIKEKIHNLIVQSYEKRDESNDLIDKANALLVKELALPPINEFQKNRLAYTVDSEELDGRFDASYHIPAVRAITSHLKKHAAEVTTVSDKRISKNIILPGRFKRVYVEEGNGQIFIGGKQITELDPSNKKYLSISHHGDRIARQLELFENMTLITSSGTIGKVALVPKHWEHWTASQHMIRVVPTNNKIAGFISIFLSSDYGYTLITRNTYGAVVDEIDDKHIAAISFPILNNQTAQTEINVLALRANTLRYEAYHLEQEALRIMDTEVIFAKEVAQ
jgi:type I restriction enzyme S subunit